MAIYKSKYGWMTEEEADQLGVHLYCAMVDDMDDVGDIFFEYFYGDSATEALELGLAYLTSQTNAKSLWLQRWGNGNWNNWVDLHEEPWATKKEN